jgi:hypothetical protein
MSLSIRPVIEMWGENLSYLSRDTSIADLLVSIADLAEEERNITTEPLISQLSDYNDMCVFYVSDGDAFLAYLETTAPAAILDALANNDQTSAHSAEYNRQSDDVMDLCRIASAWRPSIDPSNGSLRIYCD